MAKRYLFASFWFVLAALTAYLLFWNETEGWQSAEARVLGTKIAYASGQTDKYTLAVKLNVMTPEPYTAYVQRSGAKGALEAQRSGEFSRGTVLTVVINPENPAQVKMAEAEASAGRTVISTILALFFGLIFVSIGVGVLKTEKK